MSAPRLREFTSARVSLGRSGNSLPTREMLNLQLAHARARHAVHSALDLRLLEMELMPVVGETILVHSAAPDRVSYLRRPDLGRRLTDESRALLLSKKARYDAALVVADGLSALAVQHHAARMIEALLAQLDRADWSFSPVVAVEQGRVAIGDEISFCLGAAMSVVFIGERPGLSSSDSLGVYLTWNPHPGLTDAHRNCIPNIRAEGLSYGLAAHRLAFLMNESRRMKLSGLGLSESANLLATDEHR
jgi:ethanolamine ammonia-lyase small subunit